VEALKSHAMPRYIIRITIDKFRDLDDAVETIESLGVNLDKSFGEIPLDPHRSQFLLRGEVRVQTANNTEQIAGVEFFPDFSIGSVRGE
jgi:hypothetical protein